MGFECSHMVLPSLDFVVQFISIGIVLKILFITTHENTNLLAIPLYSLRLFKHGEKHHEGKDFLIYFALFKNRFMTVVVG